MDWIHAYASLRDHPKTKKLCRLLKIKIPEAVGLLHCLWWWSTDYAPDGDLTDVEPDVIADGAGWDGDPEEFITALLAATKEKGGYGFLEEWGGRLLIHDHEEYIGKYMSRAAKDAARKRRERAERAADVQRTQQTEAPDDEAAGSASIGRPSDVHRTSTRRPSDGARTSSRSARALTDRQREETEPPLPPQPVDNLAGPEQSGVEQAPSTDQEHETCDGAPCLVCAFPASAFGPLRRAIAASEHPEQWKLIGTNSPLDQLLAAYASHVCDACQASLGEYTRPQLDGLCERALIGAVENLKGSQDVQAVMRTRLNRFGLGELVGDRLLEELRRTKRDKARKGEPVPIGESIRRNVAELKERTPA